MWNRTSLLSLILLSSQVYSEVLLEGMTPMQNGEVADADQINSNFSGISSRIIGIEEQVDLLISTSSRLIEIPESSASSSGNQGAVTIINKDGRLVAKLTDPRTLDSSQLVELDGGILNLEANCNEDPYALTNAYQNHTQYPRLVIGIQGDCYGDIFWSEGYSKYVQEFSQNITIYGMNQTQAGIIPRPKVSDCVNNSVSPTGGRAGLVTSFNGSLYLDYVTLTLGECDIWGLLYSRGAGGDVNNVSIVGHPAAANQILLSVRHNAIVYTGNVSITGAGDNTRGLRVWNGGTVYSYGSLDVSVTNTALQMYGGGGFFSYGANISLEGASALTMSGLSRFSNLQYTEGSRTSFDGGFYINTGSFFSTQNMHFASDAAEDLKIEGAHLIVVGEMTSEVDQSFQCLGNSTVDIPADYSIPYAGGSACLNSLQWSALIRNYCEDNNAC
jgi:hypothetical protein